MRSVEHPLSQAVRETLEKMRIYDVNLIKRTESYILESAATIGPLVRRHRLDFRRIRMYFLMIRRTKPTRAFMSLVFLCAGIHVGAARTPPPQPDLCVQTPAVRPTLAISCQPSSNAASTSALDGMKSIAAVNVSADDHTEARMRSSHGCRFYHDDQSLGLQLEHPQTTHGVTCSSSQLLKAAAEGLNSLSYQLSHSSWIAHGRPSTARKWICAGQDTPLQSSHDNCE